MQFDSLSLKHRFWKRLLCVLLSIIIAFGTFIVITVGSSRLQDRLGMKSMLSAYASEIVDTKDAISVNSDSMLADNHIIDLENRDGSNTVYMFSEPISYIDETGNLKTKDISVEKQNNENLKAAGYDYSNGQNDYRINFSSDIQKGILVELEDCSYTIAAQTDYISSVGKKSSSVFLNEKFEVFSYDSAFGAQTILRFYPQLNGIKDEIVLNQNIGKNVYSFELKTENCKAVLNDDGTVSLLSIDNEDSVQTFSKPFAYDSEYVEGDKNKHYVDCAYDLQETKSGTYVLSVIVDSDWLNSPDTVYPVTIDPTTSNIYNFKDTGVYSGKPNNNYGNEQTCCFGKDSGFGYGRAYNQFSLPSVITKGTIINSAYIWERETTGRTETTYVTPLVVTGDWNETSITWNNRAGFDRTAGLSRRLINSQCTDDPTNPYWYRFDIKNAVKQWVDGKANYGLVFISNEESNNVNNWRAFTSKSYSSSAMRPYTVINYTNDTVAPTVSSVTGNATAWTNGNVTLTVNGAVDNSGGSGLNATPYSFSTTKDNYVWQSSNSKVFSSNCTVYVYVRDAVGNIRLASTQTISKIDKTAPSVASVTGNATDWTNTGVTLTANSTDSQSGIAAYSFSTVQGSYSWQTSKTKTVNENTTFYIYSKDNAGNISQPAIVEINKIDKQAPEIPIVTGNTEDWTNSDILLTAQSSDNLSGVKAYSFSLEKDKYNWQTENTFEVTDKSKLYICAQDGAGNISDACEIDLKIDKLPPTGFVSSNNSAEWVNSVTITADAADEISGLHEKPYSFSNNEGIYSWQSGNEKVITSNGTYYIYARDYVGNITLLDTITFDNIDGSAPFIYDVDIQYAGDKEIITILAEDTQSGISEYSIDSGLTWQDNNVFEIEKDSKTTVSIKVRDNANNIATREYSLTAPKLYYEDGRVGLYSPQIDYSGAIYYNFSSHKSGCKTYTEPIYLADCENTIYLSYTKAVTRFKDYERIYYKSLNRFAYSESNVDLSLNYNSVPFDIARKYSENEWLYSFESYLAPNYNSTLINVKTVDFKNCYFVRQSKYLYLNEINGYELTVAYDENDENIVEYILKYNNLDYHYSSQGKLVSIGNSYGDAFTFTYNENGIVIEDGAGRQTVISKTNHQTIISAPDGEIITYQLEDGRLVRVTDQTDIVIGEYTYAENKLIKSMDKSIFYDSDDRVIEYLYDNGYSVKFEYGENTVTTITSDEKTSTVTYDAYGNITSSTDNYGDITTYTYDDEHRLIKAEKDEEVLCAYGYNSNGDLNYKNENGESVVYDFDENNRVVRIYRDGLYSYYDYDENDNIIVSAVFRPGTEHPIPNGYNPYSTFESVVKYDYENNHLIRMEDIDNKTETSYTYDSYDRIIKTIVTSIDEDDNILVTTADTLYDEFGNIVKTTSTKEENGEISIAASSNTYDIMGRLLLSTAGESETEYVYDAAGRTLLIKSDEGYSRTVYDNQGRVVQEIYNDDYNPELDNLPDAYTDKNVGHTYIYSDTNNLISETNEYGITTDYEYSDVGTLYKKSFDIYDYYYQNNGRCDKIDVSGETVIDYEYTPIEDAENAMSVFITYADGTVEKHLENKYGYVYSKSLNGKLYYSSSNLLTKPTILNQELDIVTTITEDDNIRTYKRTGFPLVNQFIFDYTVTTEDESTTIAENHYDRSFETVITQNNKEFTSAAGVVNYAFDYENDVPTETVKFNDETLLTSEYTYNGDDNSATKTLYYDVNGEIVDLIIRSEYDDNGNISAMGYNADYTYSYYTYDDNNQLVRVDDNFYEYTNVYSYDERGNITSKNTYNFTIADNITTALKETINYSYDNEQWLDQLTAVNGTPLTYDANGNLASYGDTIYTWTHGKWLSLIKDGGNTYSYRYDENGIRSEKYVNGVKTEFNTLNGVLLSQKTGDDLFYFQYDAAGAPIGFVYNDEQYLYMTNQLGDIVSIVNAQGRELVEYEYDEWGGMKDITLMMDGENAKTIANLNPYRYRGYYYDTETGMYYLQSRYYNPEWGRFISADDFGNLDTSKKYFNMNAYIYCWNCPVSFEDSQGTSPTLSVDLQALAAFVVSTNDKINDSLSMHFQDNLQKLQNKYTSAIEQAKFYYYNPGALLSKMLSFITGTNVNIELKTLKWIRENNDFDAQSDGENYGISYLSEGDDKKINPDGRIMPIFQGLFSGIVLNEIYIEFKAINIDLIDIMNESINHNWYGVFQELMFTSIALFSAIYVEFEDYLGVENLFVSGTFKGFDALVAANEKNGDIEEAAKGKSFLRALSIISALISFSESIDNAGNGVLSKNTDIVLSFISLGVDIASMFIEIPFLDDIVSSTGRVVPKVVAMRIGGFVIC